MAEIELLNFEVLPDCFQRKGALKIKRKYLGSIFFF
jgi:hypothetical protein